jgi:hypothetical protein
VLILSLMPFRPVGGEVEDLDRDLGVDVRVGQEGEDPTAGERLDLGGELLAHDVLIGATRVADELQSPGFGELALTLVRVSLSVTKTQSPVIVVRARVGPRPGYSAVIRTTASEMSRCNDRTRSCSPDTGAS